MSAKSDTYGSDYLYSEDLLHQKQYKTVEVEIAEVIPPNTLRTQESKPGKNDGRLIDKWSLKFQGKDKTLVLCKTNASIIHHITGDAPGPIWVGAKITLQVRVIEAFGDMCTAIRVMPPTGCMIRKSLIKRLGTKAVWKGNTE